MSKKVAAFAIVIAGAVLAACTGHAGGNVVPATGSVSLPAIAPDVTITATLPKNTVGEELPSEGVGTYKSPFWKATIGGFTQTQFSQTLAFPPDTKITLRNLSKTNAHTLNVIEAVKGPPAKFPANPSLPTSPSGHGILGTGYRSGVFESGQIEGDHHAFEGRAHI